MTPASPALRAACATLLLLAAAAPARAASPVAPASAPSAPVADATPFDVAADPDYANYRAAVVDYLVSRHARADAHVCVLGERGAGGERSVSVWWREGARLVDWEGRDAKLATSASSLDLKRDVVASQDDLHGSTYLVTRQWVADFKARCTRSGTSFIVRRAELAAPRARH